MNKIIVGNRIVIGSAALALVFAATAAGAQLVGGAGVGGAIGGTIGGVTTGAGANAGADANVDATPTIGAATGTLDSTTGAIGATARGAADASSDAANSSARAAARTSHSAATHSRAAASHMSHRSASGGGVVRVGGGGRVRAQRSSRCYDGTDYYSPDYDDGSYYCESRSAGVGANVDAGVKIGH